ncbi:DUF397 domain-containing protein [Streptomyces sp. CB02959]|uniref:DUF397 domain-containing protein n=1 Tax=Streptomyces sp. CB02959 TaxID=2020330 RepID=UPI000C275EB9|nr:DUF397 domain-containing protein [Streptomyces sp. CB02959]PJN41656.1 DUF397 domain-containing protein [Streptomyces sp. CB02959]
MSLKPSVGHATALAWIKSSYSGQGNGNECVEVAWTKSSYSDSSNINDCVEVAPTTIHIRDSKNATGPHLHIPPAAWTDFVAFARR